MIRIPTKPALHPLLTETQHKSWSPRKFIVICPLKVKGGVHRWTMKHREGWPASATSLGLNRRLQSPVAAAGSVRTRSQAHCKAPTNLGRLQIRLWISTMFTQIDWMEFERWEIRALPRTGQKQTAWFPSQRSPALETFSICTKDGQGKHTGVPLCNDRG